MRRMRFREVDRESSRSARHRAAEIRVVEVNRDISIRVAKRNVMQQEGSSVIDEIGSMWGPRDEPRLA
jgi:hypothetical protein